MGSNNIASGRKKSFFTAPEPLVRLCSCAHNHSVLLYCTLSPMIQAERGIESVLDQLQCLVEHVLNSRENRPFERLGKRHGGVFRADAQHRTVQTVKALLGYLSGN